MAIEQIINDPRSEREKLFGRLIANPNIGNPLIMAQQEMSEFSGRPLVGGQIQYEALRTLYGGLANALGREPNEQEFTSFLNSNLDKTLAKDLLGGRINIDSASQLASQYAQSKGLNRSQPIAGPSQAEIEAQAQRIAFENAAREQSAQEQAYLDQLTKQQESAAIDALKEQLGEQLRRQAVEGAQMGRLSQPAQQENVNRATSAFSGDLAKAIGQIRAGGLGTKAQAQESLLQRLQNQSQFAQQLGQQGRSQSEQLALQKQLGIGGLNLQNKSLLEQIRQYDVGVKQNQADRDIALKLGQMKADASKPGILDYIKSGVDIGSGLVGFGGRLKKLIG